MNENKMLRDAVVRPDHYNQGEIEPIKYIQSHKMGFEQGNVIKYVTRYKHKGCPVEDLRKAMQYLEWLVKVTEEEIERKSK